MLNIQYTITERLVYMRVLILSATTGGGHMRAANALKDFISKKDPDAVIEIADTIECISPFINKAVTGGYLYMVRKTPMVYGTVYKTVDKNKPITKTVEFTTSALSGKLLPLIREFNPDIVVTTHPLAAEIITAIKKHGLINLPIVNIVTDFAIHQAYISDGVDAYIVSSREMVDEMVDKRGVERVRLYPYGIPIKNEFFKQIDLKSAFESEGLDQSLPTILVMAGSFGVTDVLKIYHKIVKSPVDFQVIVITGKNEKLYDTFDKYLRKLSINNALLESDLAESEIWEIKQSSRLKRLTSRHKKPFKPTKLIYYTNEVEKYMQMADMIVTKPGGLTVSEAIATGLPLGIFKAIPGQEEQNADYLVEKNMAVRLEKNNNCTRTITDLLEHPEKLEKMRKAVKQSSKGNSSENIYLLMLDLINKYKK